MRSYKIFREDLQQPKLPTSTKQNVGEASAMGPHNDFSTGKGRYLLIKSHSGSVQDSETGPLRNLPNLLLIFNPTRRSGPPANEDLHSGLRCSLRYTELIKYSIQVLQIVCSISTEYPASLCQPLCSFESFANIGGPLDEVRHNNRRITGDSE